MSEESKFSKEQHDDPENPVAAMAAKLERAFNDSPAMIQTYLRDLERLGRAHNLLRLNLAPIRHGWKRTTENYPGQVRPLPPPETEASSPREIDVSPPREIESRGLPVLDAVVACPRMIPSDVPGTLRRILAAWPGSADSLAEATGTNQGTLSRWANGKRVPLTTHWAEWLSKAGPVLEAALSESGTTSRTAIQGDESPFDQFLATLEPEDRPKRDPPDEWLWIA